MQDGNFLLSALQPEAGVCSLALPSDLQLDRRGAEGPEAERLRAARVQEQVRARLLQLGQQPRHNGAAEPEPEAETARGRPRRKAGAGRRGQRRGRRWRREVSVGGGGRARAEAAVRLAPDSPGLTLSHAPRPNGRGEKPWVGLPSKQGPPGPPETEPGRPRLCPRPRASPVGDDKEGWHMAGGPGPSIGKPGTHTRLPQKHRLTHGLRDTQTPTLLPHLMGMSRTGKWGEVWGGGEVLEESQACLDQGLPEELEGRAPLE